MSNFDYLKTEPAFVSFAEAAAEAELVYHTSPAMCAAGCRKALECAAKWLCVQENIDVLESTALMNLIHLPDFRFLMPDDIWLPLKYIVKLGNSGLHDTGENITAADALSSLSSLFYFLDWIAYEYAETYPEATPEFDPKKIPKELSESEKKKIAKTLKQQQQQLQESQDEIEKLKAELAELQAKSAELAAVKEKNQKTRPAYKAPEKLSEYEIRKQYIDLDLKLLGWKFDGVEVREEYPVSNMAGVPGQKGFADYVLFGKDGLPLAVIEAKKTTKDLMSGLTQAQYYADSLEQQFGQRPVIFLSNGLKTRFWDETTGPMRDVSGFFSRGDLEKLKNHRETLADLTQVPISREITGRHYQIEAIRAVCENITGKRRKNLLVMATGTGKTRTAASLYDVLARGNYVTNALFLADRTALVKQAYEAFHEYLPDVSLCNLLEAKEERNACVVFSTYPTILNAIDTVKTQDGLPIFTPAHFDLIIIDESHRSIFRKYRAIFDYFDAFTVGLTATPKTEVDKNTYEFFDCPDGDPTYVYDYDTAVSTDHVLVPYHTVSTKLKFLENGIRYKDLSKEDQEKYEELFSDENGSMPDSIDPKELNHHIFNQSTVDIVLQDLMQKGIHVAGGDRIAKTIIFAQNKQHADYIVERFNALYPQYGGAFCRRIVCDDAYAQNLIDDFKMPKPPAEWSSDLEKNPQIAVSVDMMDTGIDVPQIGNLVFFKKVFSATKFWQMIGRGTRLCPKMTCTDGENGEYQGKQYFYIFDYCGNFEFFDQKPQGIEGKDAKSLSEVLFCKRISIIAGLQNPQWQEEEAQAYRSQLAGECLAQIQALNTDLAAVKLYREEIEHYRDPAAFDVLLPTDVQSLADTIAPLISPNDPDEWAKRYDSSIYSMMLAILNGGKDQGKAASGLTRFSTLLQKKSAIPQVAEKMPLIMATSDSSYWTSAKVTDCELVRVELRSLMKFLIEGGNSTAVFSDLTDQVLSVKSGMTAPPAEDFEDYKAKVNQYVLEHGDNPAIYKLTHNIRMTEADYRELERILKSELGTSTDYEKAFQKTPLGILVRKVAGMDHDAAMKAFSDFIENECLNVKQTNFVKQIVAYIEKNGYVEVAALANAPFDQQGSYFSIFDQDMVKLAKLFKVITQVNDNALPVSAA